MKPMQRWEIASLIHQLENEIAWLDTYKDLFDGFEEVRQTLIARNYERLRRMNLLYGQTARDHV